MKPTMQTKLWSADGSHNGNCFAACIASLLEIPLWMVPAFDEMIGTRSVNSRVSEWLDRFANLEVIQIEGHQLEKLPEFYIASGPSARGILHATIYRRGQIAHDPHPSNAGLHSVEFTRHLQKVIPGSPSSETEVQR